MPRLYLASRSPRRRALLEQIGVIYNIVAIDVDESRLVAEAPADYVLRLAQAKAAAGLAAVDAGAVVLGADTAVVVDGDVLGKPAGSAHARAMLARLSGRSHEVFSGVAVTDGERIRTALSRSRVIFRDIGTDEIERYVESGEGVDKAGGYAIQGRGALFVARLEGSYSGVMGLPLCETAVLLDDLGVEIW